MTNEMPLVIIDQYFNSYDSAVHFLSDLSEKKDPVKRIIAYFLVTSVIKIEKGHIGKSLQSNFKMYNKIKEKLSIPNEPLILFENTDADIITNCFSDISDYLKQQDVSDDIINEMVANGMEILAVMHKGFKNNTYIGFCWQFMHIYILLLEYFKVIDLDQKYLNSQIFVFILHLHVLTKNLKQIDEFIEQMLKKVRPDLHYDASLKLCFNAIDNGLFAGILRGSKLYLIWDYYLSLGMYTLENQIGQKMACLLAHMISLSLTENSQIDKNFFDTLFEKQYDWRSLVKKPSLYIDGENAYKALLVKIASFTISLGFGVYLYRRYTK